MMEKYTPKYIMLWIFAWVNLNSLASSFALEAFPEPCDCPAPNITVTFNIKEALYTATVKSDHYHNPATYAIEWVLQGGVAQRVKTRSALVAGGGSLTYDIQAYITTGAHLSLDVDGQYYPNAEIVRALNNPKQNPQHQLHLPPQDGGASLARLNYKVFIRRVCSEGNQSAEVESSFALTCLPVEELTAEVFDNPDGNGYANINWSGHENTIKYKVSVTSGSTNPQIFETNNTGYLLTDMNRSSVYKVTVANMCADNSTSIRSNINVALEDACPKPFIRSAVPDQNGNFSIQGSYVGQLATVLVAYRPNDDPFVEAPWTQFTISPVSRENPEAYIRRNLTFELGPSPHLIQPGKAYKLRIKLLCKLTPEGIILSQSEWTYADLIPSQNGARLSNDGRSKSKVTYNSGSRSIMLTRLELDSDISEYHLYDLLGREVQRGDIASDGNRNVTIPLKSLSNGLYLFTWLEDGIPIVSKFLIE